MAHSALCFPCSAYVEQKWSNENDKNFSLARWNMSKLFSRARVNKYSIAKHSFLFHSFFASSFSASLFGVAIVSFVFYVVRFFFYFCCCWAVAWIEVIYGLIRIVSSQPIRLTILHWTGETLFLSFSVLFFSFCFFILLAKRILSLLNKIRVIFLAFLLKHE